MRTTLVLETVLPHVFFHLRESPSALRLSPKSPELLLRPGGSRSAEAHTCREAGGLRGAGLGGALGAGLTFSGTCVASAGRDLAEYSRHHKGECLEYG